jgi:hypothetical protein
LVLVAITFAAVRTACARRAFQSGPENAIGRATPSGEKQTVEVKYRKKRAGRKPCSKNCVDPFSRKLDLILIDGLTLLVRARAPPETWTTRLQPLGQPEPALVDHFSRLVTIFGNDCSKFDQFAK